MFIIFRTITNGYLSLQINLCSLKHFLMSNEPLTNKLYLQIVTYNIDHQITWSLQSYTICQVVLSFG